jgi:hypothetical protein
MRKDFFDDERELIFPTDSERVCQPPNPFQGSIKLWWLNPALSLSSNTGLKLANAFGVKTD